MVRRLGHLLLDDADDLAQFVHQLGLVLQPAGRVDQDDVMPVALGCFQRVEGETGRIGTDLALDHGRPGALTPDRDLLDRGSAERVAGGEERIAALALQLDGNLAERGGLA
jgi:hypothetical protein